MKSVRVWLLILLAVLLPLRAVSAQTLPCAVGHAQHTVHAGTPAATDGQGHARHHAEVATAAQGGDASHVHSHSHMTSDAGQCSACATCCNGAPASSLLASLALVHPSGSVKFSSWSAPVPSVVLDGLERPPRSA